MSEDEWNVGSCRGVLTPPSAPPWPFPHLLTVTIYVWLGHPRHRTSKRDISSWNFDISPNGIRAGWRFLLLSMTLACVLLFQITSSVRHGCRRPTAAPRGGWWLDNLVTGMGWNWQNRWLAPILWTRDWPFPAQCSGSKSEKGKKGDRDGAVDPIDYQFLCWRSSSASPPSAELWKQSWSRNLKNTHTAHSR